MRKSLVVMKISQLNSRLILRMERLTQLMDILPSTKEAGLFQNNQQLQAVKLSKCNIFSVLHFEFHKVFRNSFNFFNRFPVNDDSALVSINDKIQLVELNKN